MEALKASVENAQRGGSAASASKSAKGAKTAKKKASAKKVQPKLAPSTRERTTAKRKKKSG
jgi:hypothetical protein